MADLTLDDLLASGVNLEDILFNNNEAPVINITVDTHELVQSVQQTANSNVASLNSIRDIITTNNKSNKDLLIKALSVLIQKDKENSKNSVGTEIVGIKVVRNKLNLIDELRYIRK